MKLPHMISMHDVAIRFGEVQALNGVSLAVARGEFVALVGPNGSGKTTLLRAMHGLLRIRGRRELAPEAQRQAMVFQRPFMMRLSVRTPPTAALIDHASASMPRARQVARSGPSSSSSTEAPGNRSAMSSILSSAPAGTAEWLTNRTRGLDVRSPLMLARPRSAPPRPAGAATVRPDSIGCCDGGSTRPRLPRSGPGS